jgi:hypothetical protein
MDRAVPLDVSATPLQLPRLPKYSHTPGEIIAGRMKIIRRAVAGTAAFILVLAIVAVGAELVARFVVPPYLKYLVLAQSKTWIYEPSELGTPGVTGAGVFRTNSFGMRSDEPLPDRKQTIYVFGGSTAAEEYVDQERTWALQIQKKLNAAPQYPKTWVGNLAVPGALVLQQELMMQYLVPEMPKPDLIIDQVGGTDVQRAIHSSYPDVSVDVIKSWVFRKEPPYWQRLAIVRLYNSLGSIDRFKADGNIGLRRCRQEAPAENITDQLPDLTGPLAEFRKSLENLVEGAEALGIKMSFLTQPSLWSAQIQPPESERLIAGGVGPHNDWCEKRHYYSPAALEEALAKFNATTLDVCRERKLFCVDLASAVPKKAKYFQDDLHTSDVGDDLISDIVSNAIRGDSMSTASHDGNALGDARHPR